MDGADWADPGARAIAIYLDGSDDPDRAEDGTPMLDDDFLVLVNSWWEPLSFTVPPTRPGAEWQAEIDSYDPAAPAARANARPAIRSPSGPGPSWCCPARSAIDHARYLAQRPRCNRPIPGRPRFSKWQCPSGKFAALCSRHCRRRCNHPSMGDARPVCRDESQH